MPTLLETADALAGQTFDHIPIIDLSLPESELVSQIREACLIAGFFYVKNHSVPEQLVTSTFSYAEKFFLGLSEEDKMKVHMGQSNAWKGYMPLMSENTDPENRGDLHEAYNLADEKPSDPRPAEPFNQDADGKHDRNLWPEEPVSGKDDGLQGFRVGVLDYYQEVLSLGKRLYPIFALALDLPREYFDDKTKSSSAIMRMMHYPPQSGPHDDRLLGIGAHTDYETITILRQMDGLDALQVLNKQGEWISAPPIPGTFVINIGDQLARWSNDVFLSTRHRAINRSGATRFSLPFFLLADDDCLLTPFPTCVSESRPAKYEPVTAGDYLRKRLEETYAASVGGKTDGAEVEGVAMNALEG